MEQLWTALASAGLAGVFALLGIWYGSRREHTHWLRDARRRSYSDFLAALLRWQIPLVVGDVFSEKFREAPGDFTEDPTAPDLATFRENLEQRAFEVYRSMSAISITGPPDVADAAERYWRIARSRDADDSKEQEAEERFLTIARSALKSAK